MNYDESVLDPTDESDAARTRLRHWIEGVSRGFHDRRLDDDGWQVFLDMCRHDRIVPRGFWLAEGEFGAGTLPVATFSHFDKDLNVGGAHVGTRMITDITVSPAHRRRGLLRRMMEANLADAVAQGVPTACLTVSEATIYGRFGFGPATFRRTIELDTSRGFRVDGPVDPGRMELVEPGDSWEVMSSIFERFHETTRGSVRRPYFYQPLLTGSYDFDNGGGQDKKSRLAVHLDATGTPDGYVLYKHKGYDEKPATVEVINLVAPDPAAHLALWRFLGDVDLSSKVTWSGASTSDLLRWSLEDRHRLKITQQPDHLWVRVLDVPAALQARPWYADGRVVLDIDDAQGHAAGRWSVSVSGGAATVGRTEDKADVRLPVDTLGALYLGGVDVTTLALAGRLTGSTEAVGRFAALADGGPAPYSVTSF